MNWDDVRVFLAVHRAGSFAEAARSLDLNATTVARRLERMERMLEATLFQRTPDGLVATASAEAIIERALAMQRAASLIRDCAAGDDTRLVGTVTISVTPIYANHFLLRHLGDFHAQHPNIVVEVMPSPELVDLSRGMADLAVRYRAPGAGPGVEISADNVIARPLGDAGIGIYASRDYIAKRGMPRDAFDLTGHLAIVPGQRHSTLQGHPWFQAARERASHTILVSDFDSMAAAALAGLGLACVPPFLAINHPDLVHIGPPSRIEYRDTWLLMPADLRRVARVRALRDYIIDLHDRWASLLSGEAPIPVQPRSR